METDTNRAFDLQLFAENDSAETVDTSGDNGGGNADETLLTGTADNAAETQTDNAADNKDTADKDAADDKTPTGAPEAYADFELPEGMAWDAERSASFVDAMKECGLNQEQAQKMISIGAKMMGEAQNVDAKAAEITKGWQNESKEKYTQNDLDLANKTLGQFADQGLIDFLAQSGLGNHPQMIGLFKNIGEAIADGSFVDGKAAERPLSLAERLYGN